MNELVCKPLFPPGHKLFSMRFKTSFCEFDVVFGYPETGPVLVAVGNSFPDMTRMNNEDLARFVECGNLIEERIPVGRDYVIRWPKKPGQRKAMEIRKIRI